MGEGGGKKGHAGGDPDQFEPDEDMGDAEQQRGRTRTKPNQTTNYTRALHAAQTDSRQTKTKYTRNFHPHKELRAVPNPITCKFLLNDLRYTKTTDAQTIQPSRRIMEDTDRSVDWSNRNLFSLTTGARANVCAVKFKFHGGILT